MFDKRFEQTDDSVSMSSNRINKRLDNDFPYRTDDQSYSLRRRSVGNNQCHQNSSKSLLKSPIAPPRESLLNPQIIQSRNEGSAQVSKIFTNDAINKQLSNQIQYTSN